MKTNKYFDMKTINNMLRSEYEIFIGRRHSGKTPVIAQRIYELEDHISILKLTLDEFIDDAYFGYSNHFKEKMKEQYITRAYRKFYHLEEEDDKKASN